MIFQFYRSLLPISVWYFYFQDPETPMLSLTLSSLYFVIKFHECFKYFRVCYQIFSLAVFQKYVIFFSFFISLFFFFFISYSKKKFVKQFGQFATENEINQSDGVCAICHDKMKSPLKLICQVSKKKKKKNLNLTQKI